MTKYDGYNHRIFQLVESHKRVLDVGCATGRLLEKLAAEKQCVTFGVEADPEMAEQARRRGGQVTIGNVESLDLPFPPASFDVVICADVLEHLQDPGHALRKLAVCLKDDGYLLVSMPNIAFIIARLNLLFGRFDYTEHGIMDRGHLHFFTLKTTQKLLSDNGFRVVQVEGYNQVRDRFFPLRPLGRWWKTLFAIDFVIKATKNSTDTKNQKLFHHD